MTASTRVAIGDLCSLYIDLPLDEPAIIPGDWIVTEAGSRYLVASARLVKSRQHAQRSRWQMRVHRLPKDCEIPADVRAIELRWYKR